MFPLRLLQNDIHAGAEYIAGLLDPAAVQVGEAVEEEFDGATGPLRIDPTDRRPVGRAYRVIEVNRGRGETVELVTAAG